MCAPAKVAQLDVPSLGVNHKDVLWLDVPVDHIALLKKPQGRYDLLNDFTHNVLGEVVGPLELLV